MLSETLHGERKANQPELTGLDPRGAGVRSAATLHSGWIPAVILPPDRAEDGKFPIAAACFGGSPWSPAVV